MHAPTTTTIATAWGTGMTTNVNGSESMPAPMTDMSRFTKTCASRMSWVLRDDGLLSVATRAPPDSSSAMEPSGVGTPPGECCRLPREIAARACRRKQGVPTMDVMMNMTTDDVRKLREKFTSNLSLEEFVTVMKTSLADRISSELDFVVGAIDLFHTIDVNGDKTLEWDEFAGYMLDAGQAKADFLYDDLAEDKLYQPWTTLSFRDAKTPMNNIKSFIQQLVFLADLGAVAYFEHGADVVHVYSLHFDGAGSHDAAAPRHVSTIRLHTAFQEHVVLSITYIPNRRWLVISSMLAVAYLSVWELPDVAAARGSDAHAHTVDVAPPGQPHNLSPMMLHRVELRTPQEQLTWLPSLQVLATAAVLYPTISSKSDGYRAPPLRCSHTKHHQLVLWDVATLTTLNDWDHRDQLKGVTSMVSFTSSNHRILLVVGHGMLSVVDAESGQETQTTDAHPHGVKALAHSAECEVLASSGMHSYADESTLHVLIWRISSIGRLSVAATLRDNDAAVTMLAFVDSKRQLLSCDIHGVFHVYSCAPRPPTHEPWQCLQVFSSLAEAGGYHVSANYLSPAVTHVVTAVILETPRSDAVLLAARGRRMQFFDVCVHRAREEVIFAYYCRELNVVLAATPTQLLLWHAHSGEHWKTFAYSAIIRASPSSGVREGDNDHIDIEETPRTITAVCVDDRERKVILGDDRGSIRVLNAINGNVMKAMDPHACAVVWLAYVLRSKRVVSISLDGALHVYDENDAVGYYVPFGGGKPHSVMLQSLRFLPDSSPSRLPKASVPERHDKEPSKTGDGFVKFEIIKAIGNQALNLLAVLIGGPHGESFIQVWSFDLSHAQGTCLAPDRQEVRAGDKTSSS
ncbi:hypothetical protein P43SY_006628 [Pythium insidiosum]|uniref:EF-hand domain-containing protein n=1 Tax=Pythium insidiosum TaxID=114742 RepID=A0AAD5M1G8_PYTIN|nr:hypothetical protein P43SY_006628 [Pythium insidiosum]